MKSLLFALLVLASLFTAGCETTGQSAMLGAGLGAAVAAATGNDALGGAAIGAASGALIGHVAKHERERAYEDGYYEGRHGRGYPVGHRTEHRGFVVSPYEPHNVIDVRGIPRGERVEDPSCGRIFIKP
jgi:predicted small secreted protein